MTSREAEKAGYRFTGHSNQDKEVSKARAKELRAAGNKAIVVHEPPNKYSRGHSSAFYRVYMIESEANAVIRKRENATKAIQRAQYEVDRAAKELAEKQEALRTAVHALASL